MTERFALFEHAQHMAQKDFERFAKLHVIASMQPYHAIDDGRWAEARLGHERARYSYAWRTFLDHGVSPSLHRPDGWAFTPRHGAVTRRENTGGWIPEEKITLAEAIEATHHRRGIRRVSGKRELLHYTRLRGHGHR